MAVQNSVAVRNATLDAKEAAIGASPRLQLRSGPPPADCAAADAGIMLAEFTLPADWAPAASNGVKTLAAIPEVTAAASGNAGHYRVKNSAGATCHEQGTVGHAGEGADMTVDNVSIRAGQRVSVGAWTMTAAGA